MSMQFRLRRQLRAAGEARNKPQ